MFAPAQWMAGAEPGGAEIVDAWWEGFARERQQETYSSA